MKLADGTEITRVTLEEMVETLTTVRSQLDSLQAILGDIQEGWVQRDTPKSHLKLADKCLEILEMAQTDMEDSVAMVQDTEDALGELIDIWPESLLAFREAAHVTE